jgi:Domain of unknown function (DU1801)
MAGQAKAARGGVTHPCLGCGWGRTGRFGRPGIPRESGRLVSELGSISAGASRLPVPVVQCDTETVGEPKTRPTVASVEEFLHAATPIRRQEDGLRLAEIFREVTGAEPILWGPSIVGYGSYRYVSPADPRRHGEWPKTGFSPRKAQLSLYGLKDLPEGAALLPSLGTYTEGAGCVYVKKLSDIDVDVLRQLIAIAWSRPDDPMPTS